MIRWIMVCVRTVAFTINVNGVRAGYFKGERGLRQGDPISLYIFTLVMEVFTLILQKHISEDVKFKYHWGCKDLQLLHLCFADDLLVLCHGDLNSVKVVKRALDMFSSISGLNPNSGKSTVFFGNVKEHDKQEILPILPFKIGSLPVSYLGVPLITKHITFTGCKVLIDKVKIKVNDWKNKILSYAGKLSKGKEKVAWNQVCKPKDEGGLGIKNLSIWNEILMAKHLWNIATMKNPYRPSIEVLCILESTGCDCTHVYLMSVPNWPWEEFGKICLVQWEFSIIIMGLPIKLAIASATVMSTAAMLKVLTPFFMNLAISDIPAIWISVIAWLKPPYLYVVINCIIITIVASSRLQSKFESYYSMSTYTAPVPLQNEQVKVVLPPIELPPVHMPEVSYHDTLLVNEHVKFDSQPKYVQVPEQKFTDKFVLVPEHDFSDEYVEETPEQDIIHNHFGDEDMKIAKEAYEEIKRNKVKKSVISMSNWTPPKMNRMDLGFSVEKPPASARFSHRKPVKGAHEGGRTLGVAKPKKQDTLENTWKTITEGRSVPLTKHLRKSETWETHGQSRENHGSEELNDHHSSKSDTFDVSHGGTGSRKPPAAPSKLNRSGGSGRLRKDPSLGQEELNRKVEAFIRKFNEDMRLQRQESMNQFMEMINRGAH
nr:RNA-directed DNA polymerase, eukaryota, reverse transcriptase zinc-binding domain protein [Tanacetum cinerariifolium]